MRMHEELLVAGFTAVAEKHGAAIEEVFGFPFVVPTAPFPRVTLADARRIVAEGGYEIPRADGDLDPEAERRIAAWAKETHGSEFVFVTDYDASIRPYYHMRHADDPTLTNSYDLIFNGAEISTGAQREHRVDVLSAQALDKGMDLAEIDWYLDFFRYGVPPHGGFGMGLARVLMLALHEPSIREVTYLFRGPTRLLP
jgi:aspartyl-tRNA synthetase